MSLKHTILGLIAKEPIHGYRLKAAYNSMVPNADVNYGQIYQALKQLHLSGLVIIRVLQQDLRPDRKMYEISPLGEEELSRWLGAKSRLSLDLQNEIVLKVITAMHLPDVDALAVLENEQQACTDQLKQITTELEESSKDESSPATRMMLDLATLQAEATLKWLGRWEEQLKKETDCE